MNNDSPRNFLITGAASGIGKAVAAALLGDGHKITVVDVNAESLASAKQELGPDERVHFVHADITSDADCERAVAGHWDTSLAPATAAAKIARSIGWPELTGDVIWLG
jgi:NAD(P)-dependent dehydrogenase (short-subunit alcohol dehydrogenase family)